MNKPIGSVKAIFDLALELAPGSQRQAYLDEACAEAPEFRQKVESLLQAYKEAGSFLEKPPVMPTGPVALVQQYDQTVIPQGRTMEIGQNFEFEFGIFIDPASLTTPGTRDSDIGVRCASDPRQASGP